MTENGASAEFVLAPAELLTGAPTSIPLVDAAALPPLRFPPGRPCSSRLI